MLTAAGEEEKREPPVKEEASSPLRTAQADYEAFVKHISKFWVRSDIYVHKKYKDATLTAEVHVCKEDYIEVSNLIKGWQEEFGWTFQVLVHECNFGKLERQQFRLPREGGCCYLRCVDCCGALWCVCEGLAAICSAVGETCLYVAFFTVTLLGDSDCD